MKTNDWDISIESWFCSHPGGFTAFIDPIPTSSSAIRILGPWVPDKTSKHDVALALGKLVRSVESLGMGEYVVFGGYAADAASENYEFPIYHSKCGFVPSLSIRGKVTNNALRDREWLKADRHRSGLKLENCPMDLDVAVVHPITIEGDLYSFCSDLRLDTSAVPKIATVVQNYIRAA